ncbi:alpha-ketoglutarate-dependent dioxygenase AlkB [Streptomyces sp. NPDC102441]|uniref:alpha-ketoglutarate-dependent dioxygenase AlkB n=1 Tax=Streptomyces sp. NPDC102441 TaxID=3366176 RepID=UPI003812D0BC
MPPGDRRERRPDRLFGRPRPQEEAPGPGEPPPGGLNGRAPGRANTPGAMRGRRTDDRHPSPGRSLGRSTRTADDVNGRQVAAFPDRMVRLGRRALLEAYGDEAAVRDYTPDTALINFYDGQARMGMHQDKDERSSAPVVSLSIGDTCVFRVGNTETRTRPYTDIELSSGDLFVLGGPSRFAYHGVPKVHESTGDPATGLRSGRLNITMRVTGLT